VFVQLSARSYWGLFDMKRNDNNGLCLEYLKTSQLGHNQETTESQTNSLEGRGILLISICFFLESVS
jgi:hypothetical protein